MAEEKYILQRRESRHLRSGKNQKAHVSGNILEAIAQLSPGGEKTRMKIMVKKEDLKQVLEAIRDGQGATRLAAKTTSFEQRLNWMRRRQILRQLKGRKGMGAWRPVLQSIPEEV